MTSGTSLCSTEHKEDKWTEKDLEGSDNTLVRGSVPKLTWKNRRCKKSTSVKITSASVEMINEYISITSLKRYRFTNLGDDWVLSPYETEDKIMFYYYFNIYAFFF
jgi:hypothetical protein